MNSATLDFVTHLEEILAKTHPVALSGVQVAMLLGAPFSEGDPEALLFTDLAYDSRKVTPGSLFVALRGEKVDGHNYLRDAWERGARGVVSERDEPSLPIPQVVVPDSRRALSRLSDIAFEHPSHSLTTIGITGTKGKTSTSFFLRHLLETAGHPTGVIGTLGWHAMSESVPLPLTTPESLELHRLLAALRNVGCTHVVMEASAHGMHFQRTRDVDFARALFTNLGQDHLDFFGTMEKYAHAKRALFTEQLLQTPDALALINIDDPEGALITGLLPRNRIITVGSGASAMVRGQLMESRSDGLRLKITVRDAGEIEILTPVIGAFFVTNLLLAAATAHSLGIDLPTIAAGLATLPPVPGRHEVVSGAADDIQVIVDYAHTPQSVAAILATADRDPARPVIALVGCGGDRDRSKRPQMGRLAYDASDRLVVTSDNPRTEDPDLIIAEILAGIPRDSIGQRVEVEPNRELAIAEAIAQAPPGSRIFILGKGHETYQILRDRTIDFDDRVHARTALNARRLARTGVAP